MPTVNPYTPGELRDDLARAGGRMSLRTIGTAKFLLLEKAKLVNGVIETTVYSNPAVTMTTDQRWTWAKLGLPNLLKSNASTTVQPIVIS